MCVPMDAPVFSFQIELREQRKPILVEPLLSNHEVELIIEYWSREKNVTCPIVLLEIIFKFYLFPLELICLLKYAPEVIKITTQADYQEIKYQRYFIFFNLR